MQFKIQLATGKKPRTVHLDWMDYPISTADYLSPDNRLSGSGDNEVKDYLRNSRRSLKSEIGYGEGHLAQSTKDGC